jgi:hypothetical protein
MLIVNHFQDIAIGSILVPDVIAAPTTNDVPSILAQAGLCQQAFGIVPNFVLVDHAEVGMCIRPLRG